MTMDVAVVTGANRGIGFELVKSLKARGAGVAAFETLEDADPEIACKLFETNALVPLFLVRALVPHAAGRQGRTDFEPHAVDRR
jgi:NAD(P)-dependent dehydrogenase (short-subunit alcohol dehydrogenase family)